MYTITKEFHFSASHVLEGLAEGHPCGRLHGHNYVVTLELRAVELNKHGFVQDYRELDICKVWIDENLDHRHLNNVFMTTTAEVLARELFATFARWVPHLTAVTVSETPKTSATYRQPVLGGV